MYWPSGAPRIYAASSRNKPQQILHLDDIESRETADPAGVDAESSSAASDSIRDAHVSEPDLLTPTTPLTPGIKPVEHEAHRTPSAEGIGSSSEGNHKPTPVSNNGHILGLKMSRTGHIFATITAKSMTIWQTKPTAILAVVVRSDSSLSTYGHNVSLLVRSDSAIFVVQTTLGYLITYSLATDPTTRVYRPHFPDNSSVQTRRQSNFSGLRNQADRILWGPGEGGGVREVSIKFRMVIKVDAGIVKALALDDELVVATQKPGAVQCIRWTPDTRGNQTNTELLSRMSWLSKKSNVIDMIHDRPMNLSAWITNDGKAYAVQRIAKPNDNSISTDSKDSAPQESEHAGNETNGKGVHTPHEKLFRGYCFHDPADDDQHAIKTAINARFSLIAVGCADGSIHVYTARDYSGNIPLSHEHKLSVSPTASGKLTFLSYSPDGYCLFAGYERGWAIWSVFGKPGGTSFTADRTLAQSHNEDWLMGVKDGAWFGGGSGILLVGHNDDRIWILEMARSAVTGCFTAANISRTVLQTSSSIVIYNGYDVPDLTAISAESSLWHNVQMPSSYLVDQWPIRSVVVSSDGRYIAIAGRRGLAHYSVNSGRWKTFVNENMENEFQVRGGMCWYQHILVAAVEAGNSYELRLFSREAALDSSLMVHVERLPAAVVLIAPSGEDSLLVYTYDNLLYHFVFTATTGVVSLIQVGQIAFHGIVRSPARVRGLSWILPDEQLQEGDPAQDVAVATVLFLVDGKLVLLQPSLTEDKKLKYDMRVISQNVEYYALMRDQPLASTTTASLNTLQYGEKASSHHISGLRDSLWVFDGIELKAWSDVQDVLRSAPSDLGRELPPTVSVGQDFYPLSILLSKGIILGVEPDLIQRRDINFAFFRFTIRTHLFIPQFLRFHLSSYDSSAALHLTHQYQQLEYFPHALEILLHNVLDEEVDTSPSPETALLPGVLSFLSSFPAYLDIIVQCTRKTEVRSWRTLFSYLPPPGELFEESLQRGSLKTAGGYLLVLHTFEELSSSSEQLVRLLARARSEGDWELCKELARFLTALDETGDTLREALGRVDLMGSQASNGGGNVIFDGSRLKVPRPRHNGSGSESSSSVDGRRSSSGSRSPTAMSALDDVNSREGSPVDYFSTRVV